MPATACKAPSAYERHRPEETTLYKLVQENWLTFKQQVAMDTGHSLPDFVVKEFEEYLRCGILAHGFLRAKCESCNFERLVAFSCQALQCIGLSFQACLVAQGLRQHLHGE
ncbi:MAG: transposase zinc-binding domain-containing protein [Bdellovibrionales bacterium]|nr:transposase zinc-binding domain-containing protein [Bdellovibrionales bacterium]